MLFVVRVACYLNVVSVMLNFQRLAGQSNVGKGFYACINVLRRAGYPQQALRLAQITGNPGDAITVLTEDLKDAPAALREIQSLPFEQVGWLLSFYLLIPLSR